MEQPHVGRVGIQVYNYTAMYNYTVIQLYSYIPRYNYTVIQLYSYIPRYNYTPIQLYSYIPRYLGGTTPLYVVRNPPREQPHVRRPDIYHTLQPHT